MKKIIDYIFLMRPMLIIPVWTIALLGARSALWRERGLSPITLDHFPFVGLTTSDLNLLLMLLFSTLLAGGVFVLNQIFDVDSDRENKKLFLLPEGHVSIREAWNIYFFLTGVALIGAFVLNWQLGCLFVVGAWFGFQYSYPRFNLREHPYKSFRNNVLAHGTLAFLFGWVMYLNFNIEGIIKSFPYFLAVGAVYLNTTLPDLHGDTAVGKKTYAAEWGVAKTLRYAAWMVAGALIFSIMIADYAFAVAAAVSLPFFIAAASTKSIATATLATKVSILALSLFAAMFFPLYLVILVLTIVGTRIYHSRKFNIAYPVIVEKK